MTADFLHEIDFPLHVDAERRHRDHPARLDASDARRDAEAERLENARDLVGRNVLPEHTREAAVLAHGMGADHIELDVVLTGDGVPIVLHDLWLDAVTDVAARFPERRREDGRHYAIDFTWDEIRTLRAHERVNEDGTATFAGRFSPDVKLFRVPAMDEMIQLIQSLNRSTGREAGIYVEPNVWMYHPIAAARRRAR